jgi:hypothetical protein
MATAANSGTPAAAGAKPQAASGSAVVNDAKQGFAASAIDDKVDAKQIPDPAGYGAAEAPTQGKTAETPVANPKVSPPAAEAASPGAALSASVPVVSAHLNPLLVAGVPLGAAVLLMGVYWLILRAGAV